MHKVKLLNLVLWSSYLPTEHLQANPEHINDTCSRFKWLDDEVNHQYQLCTSQHIRHIVNRMATQLRYNHVVYIMDDSVQTGIGKMM